MKCRVLPRTAGWLAATGLALCLPPVRGEDWPRFLGPRADGTSSETNLLEAWPESGPPLVWDQAVGPGYSAPSIANGRLVVHHRQGDAELVDCLDAATGERRWCHSAPTAYEDPYGYNNGPRSTPCLAQNRVFALGAEGRLSCLDLPTGRPIWERDTGRDWEVPPAFFGVGSSPLLEGDVLLVMVGGQPNAGMVGLDPATGRTRWAAVGESNWTGQPMLGWTGDRTVVWKRWDKQASYATPVAATVHGRRVVFCLMRQGLVALNPTNGAIHFSRWFRAPVEESVNAANPVVSGSRVLISAAYSRVGSVLLDVRPDLSGVDSVWSGTALEIHWTTPLLHEGQLYAFSGRNEPDARFRCVTFADGAIRWDRDERWSRGQRTPGVYGRGAAILAAGQLIVLGEGGRLGLFRADPGRADERCHWQVPGFAYPCWTAPVLADGRLYLRSENRLVCLDLRPARATTDATPRLP